MAYEEWNREIPSDEQLQEVARILAKAVLRKHHDPELIPRATAGTSRVRADGATARARLRERRRLDQFDDDADIDPWRRSKRDAFCRTHCTSIETVPSQELNAVVCHPHPSFDQIDMHDGLSYVMNMLSDDDRRIVMHVGTHGFRSALRELGFTRRRVEKTLKSIRHLFLDAGLGVD